MDRVKTEQIGVRIKPETKEMIKRLAPNTHSYGAIIDRAIAELYRREKKGD